MGESVTSELALVYRGGGRRYFTRKAALRAEARMIIRQNFRASGDELSDVDGVDYHAWVKHLAEKIARGNRQFDMENPLDAASPQTGEP